MMLKNELAFLYSTLSARLQNERISGCKICEVWKNRLLSFLFDILYLPVEALYEIEPAVRPEKHRYGSLRLTIRQKACEPPVITKYNQRENRKPEPVPFAPWHLLPDSGWRRFCFPYGIDPAISPGFPQTGRP